MKKIKVLHIHTLPVISGSGINTFLSMKGLDKDRYEVGLACAPSGPLIDLVKEHGMGTRAIKDLVRPLNIFKDGFALIELIRLLRKERFDILHTHNSKAGFIGRLAGKVVGIPVVVHTVHGFAFHPFENPWRRRLFIFLERLAARWCQKMIVISQSLIDWAIQNRIARPEKVIKIYSGIELDKFQVNPKQDEKRTELGIEPGEFVIGQVAKLWEGKGHRTILEAIPKVVKRIPNLKVIFVGEGNLRPRLERMARDLRIDDKVIFTGFRRDIPQLTSILDVAILASLWEGMGRSVVEAQACGKPVVASRVGGIIELVEDGETGILVPPGDPAALAGALIKLLEDSELRERMGEAGRKRMDAQFTAGRMVEQIVEVYEELTKERM